MTSTFWRRNSEAISLTRLELPSAQRYSIAAVSPLIKPSSCRRATKAAAHGFHIVAFDPRTPMRRGLLTCWAYAAIGHAPTRPQTTLMNSRRFMSVSLLTRGLLPALKAISDCGLVAVPYVTTKRGFHVRFGSITDIEVT